MKINQNYLIIGALAGLALFGIYAYRRGVAGVASDVVGGAIKGAGQATWGALEGAYNATVTPFYDAVTDELDKVSKKTTGKGIVDRLSDFLYGSNLTEYGKAYQRWLDGGKVGPRPEPANYQ